MSRSIRSTSKSKVYAPFRLKRKRNAGDEAPSRLPASLARSLPPNVFGAPRRGRGTGPSSR